MYRDGTVLGGLERAVPRQRKIRCQKKKVKIPGQTKNAGPYDDGAMGLKRGAQEKCDGSPTQPATTNQPRRTLKPAILQNRNANVKESKTKPHKGLGKKGIRRLITTITKLRRVASKWQERQPF